MPDTHTTSVDQQRLEKERIEDDGTVTLTRGGHAIHCLTVIGQVEGHTEAPQGQKTTKYEHVIPQLAAVQEDPRIEGLLVLLNTVGGDVEAGLALAELIASVSKPSATLVLGGGHSIGIPLAVSAQRSFIVPTATMTVHPVRHSGVILGVPQTMRWFDQMQQRIKSPRCTQQHSPADLRPIQSPYICRYGAGGQPQRQHQTAQPSGQQKKQRRQPPRMGLPPPRRQRHGNSHSRPAQGMRQPAKSR